MSTTLTPSQQLWAGVRAELPITLGVVPFGLIFGVLAGNSGLPPFVAWSTSSIIFAGSAQFLVLPLLASSAPALVTIFTAFIINVRHLLYSAALSEYAAPLPLSWKIINSYLLTDEAFAPTIIHYQNEAIEVAHKHWFWLGAGLTLWTTWQTSTGFGIFLGRQLPDGLGLEFTLALTFIGIVVPTLTNWPALAASLSAGVIAVVTAPLPYSLNLVFAAVIGITVGLALEIWFKRHPSAPTQSKGEEASS